MKKAIAVMLIYATFQCSIVFGCVTITYGEIEKTGGRNVEVNAVGTDQGFLLKDRNYKEGIDYLIFINNRGTSRKADDKLAAIFPVKLNHGN